MVNSKWSNLMITVLTCFSRSIFWSVRLTLPKYLKWSSIKRSTCNNGRKWPPKYILAVNIYSVQRHIQYGKTVHWWYLFVIVLHKFADEPLPLCSSAVPNHCSYHWQQVFYSTKQCITMQLWCKVLSAAKVLVMVLIITSNQHTVQDEMRTVPCTFKFTFRHADSFVNLWRFHEEWEDAAKPQDVNKLLAVVRSLHPRHGMIQNLHCTEPGHFLLPAAQKQGLVYSWNGQNDRDELTKPQHCSKVASRKCSPYLNMRFISCIPSPFRKRSLLAGSIRAEHKQLKRFSIISISSLLDGSWRLYAWQQNMNMLHSTGRVLKENDMTEKEWQRGTERECALPPAAATTHQFHQVHLMSACFLEPGNENIVLYSVT